MGTIIIIIGFFLLIAGLTFTILWFKAEKKKEKEFNAKTKSEITAMIAKKDAEVKRELKNHKHNLKQFIRSKTKKAIQQLKSGKSNTKG